MKLVKKNNSWLFAGILLVCFLVSAGVRFQQFETWKQTPQAYFVGERPMMTTLDAPYWLRLAREYNEGIYGQKGGLRGYPEGTDVYREQGVPDKYRDISVEGKYIGIVTTVVRYRDVPLLSYLIAKVAPFFDFNYYCF